MSTELTNLPAKAGSSSRINPSYPLCRFDVSYQNSLGLSDSFVIEIGYIRRYPVLKKDARAEFLHIGKNERMEIISPVKEELFANKLVTCLYRTTSRDIYDVYRIAEEHFEEDVFRKCAVMESLMQGKQPLDKLDITGRISPVPLDSYLRKLLRIEKVDFQEVKTKVISFSREVVKDLTGEELELIHDFYSGKGFKPESIDDKKIFHEKLREHPAILWALKKIF